MKDNSASRQIADIVGDGAAPIWSDYNDAHGLAIYLVDGSIVMLRAEALRVSYGEVIEPVGRWNFDELIAQETPDVHVEPRYAEDFAYLKECGETFGHDCGFLHAEQMGSRVFLVRSSGRDGEPEIKIGVVSGNHNMRSGSFQGVIRSDMIPPAAEVEEGCKFAF